MGFLHCCVVSHLRIWGIAKCGGAHILSHYLGTRDFYEFEASLETVCQQNKHTTTAAATIYY